MKFCSAETIRIKKKIQFSLIVVLKSNSSQQKQASLWVKVLQVCDLVDPLLLFFELSAPLSFWFRMAHVLQFDEQSRKVKDANVHDEDTFEIYDPRNPVNKRRREESKKLLKEKKAKWWGHEVGGQVLKNWSNRILPVHFKTHFRLWTGSWLENIWTEDADPSAQIPVICDGRASPFETAAPGLSPGSAWSW